MSGFRKGSRVGRNRSTQGQPTVGQGLPDAGDPAALQTLSLSCAADGPTCLTLELTCQDGPDCVRDDPPDTCPCEETSCASESSICSD